ncbi:MULTISPECIES: ferritin-like domain-containing protein [Achromobacter]|uniref:ferritin-like domain-containing protein n=1 Tax=Achromobacter TaxID=222 RepID=UPI0014687E4D|nr:MULTISPECIES: ferritin-like domain-containing protein [Achromobacter]MCG7327898.1 ferritin-like domain-containing protein [Achromobacter sp. ACRQX]CAB3886656.1 Protein YciE [Achromobacter animicus]
MESDTSKAAEHLLDWLRDAHAMEEQAETMLTSLAGRIETYPEVKQRIERHIVETREQQRLVRGCIERLGGDTSMFKDLTGKMMATFQGFSGVFASDEIMKGAMFSYAFENLEIAAYSQLVEAAKFVGDAETAAVCERILQEERAMAQWIEHNTPGLMRQFLMRADDPESQAKR